MKLPVMPPVSPMLSKSAASIPPGASYEPKWDGFRSICFRDFDEVELGSRNERPMTRYFAELVAAAVAELPDRCVIDGEIIEAGSAQHPKMSVIQPFLRHAALDRQDVLSRAGRTPTPPRRGRYVALSSLGVTPENAHAVCREGSRRVMVAAARVVKANTAAVVRTR